MKHRILKWLNRVYKNVSTSIAFLPAVIALSFFLLSFFMIQFDFSNTGKNIKANLHWLSLKDASTARSICTAIATGIISLAVFSFSMVMILLSQAATQMSNRILSKLITNTFQQVVLGFYIGTIVYAFFLLSTIRDIDTGVHVPAISTYLLIALTITDIFLFIYFLHYITHSVKFETIIHRIYEDTSHAVKKSFKLTEVSALKDPPPGGSVVTAYKSGLYHGFHKDGLINLCKKEDVAVYFLYPVGTYLIKNTPLLIVSPEKEVSQDFEDNLSAVIDIGKGQDIHTSFYYGFQHLMEIAVKALSPGINDPGTATIALRALGDLVAYSMRHFPETCFKDKTGTARIFTKEKTFKEMFDEYIMPIWDYGRSDRLIQNEMLHLLTMLKVYGDAPEVGQLLRDVQGSVKSAL
jgi:uncharacterized membrane protein